ncbi:MAG: VanW family protein [Verrucomicrobiota bacterium]
MPELAEERMPTRAQALAFLGKTKLFQLRRTLQNAANGGSVRALPQLPVDDAIPVIAESRSLLYPSQQGAEFGLQAGKVQNLRVAAQKLNGIRIHAGETFSFWKQIPRPTRSRGFVAGRELREGCVIPSVGGGLCQLSNALYDAALKAGFEIVERHGHSRILPGSMAEAGRDATIFWNYVDLRFKPAFDVQMEVVLGRGELVFRFRSNESAEPTPSDSDAQIPAGDAAESCETCGVTSCFRHPSAMGLTQDAVTAWLVDAYWPEHDAYIRETRVEKDWLFTPLAGAKYRWSTQGFANVRQAPVFVAKRSIISRRLAAQGAARQRALLKLDEELAVSYARRIPFDTTHLVVSQNLLPFLWRLGALGGRTFDVLMTRLPLAELQSTLDHAAKRWPESPTLADFRADRQLLADESAALAEARHWITPHSQIAKIAGEKAFKLDWQLPKIEEKPKRGQKLLFPASTLGRNGAYELRELGQPLRICGGALESPEFWSDVDVEKAEFSLDDVRAVVMPAWVASQPRRLLRAAASGIPVITTAAAGIEGIKGVEVFPEGDVEALRRLVGGIPQSASEDELPTSSAAPPKAVAVG